MKPELLRLLDELPPARQAELLNFARFLRQQVAAASESVDATLAIREAPADSLVYLTGVVALGGDAVADAEALYDGNQGGHRRQRFGGTRGHP